MSSFRLTPSSDWPKMPLHRRSLRVGEIEEADRPLSRHCVRRLGERHQSPAVLVPKLQTHGTQAVPER